MRAQSLVAESFTQSLAEPDPRGAEVIAQTPIAGVKGDATVLPESMERDLRLAEAHRPYPNVKKIGE